MQECRDAEMLSFDAAVTSKHEPPDATPVTHIIAHQHSTLSFVMQSVCWLNLDLLMIANLLRKS